MTPEKTEPNSEITTIKLRKSTKDRIEKLRVYRRESYDEIIQKILDILNTCRVNPSRAQVRLAAIERQKRKQRKMSSSQAKY
jgi:hypothetical protein